MASRWFHRYGASRRIHIYTGIGGTSEQALDLVPDVFPVTIVAQTGYERMKKGINVWASRNSSDVLCLPKAQLKQAVTVGRLVEEIWIHRLPVRCDS